MEDDLVWFMDYPAHLRRYKEMDKLSLEAQAKISKLEEGILELEAIRAMDEEIIATLKETEQDLKLDLKRSIATISEQKLQLSEWDQRAEEYEKLIQRLQEKNLRIYKEMQKASLEAQSKISKLEDGILELEAIRAMDQEIIETLKETEQDLKLDLERSLATISEQKVQLSEWDQHAEEYERVILQLHEKNTALRAKKKTDV